MKKTALTIAALSMSVAMCACQPRDNMNGNSSHYDNNSGSNYGTMQAGVGGQSQSTNSQQSQGNWERSDNMQSGDRSHKGWNREDMERKHVHMMAENMFNCMDKNNDGVITRKEYEAFTRKWFKEADTDHNGKLSFEEVEAQIKHDVDKMKARHHDWNDRQDHRLDNEYRDDKDMRNDNGQNMRNDNDRGMNDQNMNNNSMRGGQNMNGNGSNDQGMNGNVYNQDNSGSRSYNETVSTSGEEAYKDESGDSSNRY